MTREGKQAFEIRGQRDRSCHVCGREGELRECENGGCALHFHSPMCDGYRVEGRLFCYECFRICNAEFRALPDTFGEFQCRIVTELRRPVQNAHVTAGTRRAEIFRWTTGPSGLIRGRLLYLPDPFILWARKSISKASLVVSFADVADTIELVLPRPGGWKGIL